MTDMPTGYYNRHDPDQNYEKHLFRAGFVLQSAEMNEIQEAHNARIKGIGDSLFKDGDVLRDARVVVDSGTGATICEEGAVYLRGAVRGVPPANITIPIDRTVAIGIWLVESVVSDLEDPDLRDPAAETRNYNEPGASRIKIDPQWGYDEDGTADAEFFPIYYADNGALRAKEPPPALDSVSQAIARYDRDSAGSNYVVAGLRVSALDDLLDGTQVYNIEDGRARVNGFGTSLSASRRLLYPAVADLRNIDSEPKTSSTLAQQRINVDRTPIANLIQVRITKSTTATLNHGSFSGVQDPLPDPAVVAITEVKQGATTYVQGADYQLTAGKVDWSLPGAEPAPGSSYDVTYQHITTVAPELPDDEGFSVTGAVPGTLILTTYDVKLPRIDRLCLNEAGEFIWVKGVSTDYDPVRPSVPANLCAICQVVQTWGANRQVINDGVRVVPMSDIEQMNARLDLLTDLIAQQKLAGDINQRESAAKKGLFVDPFLDDLQRDQGTTQTAAVAFGALTLPVEGDAAAPSNDVTDLTTCAFTLESILTQTSRTGSMKINPYMAFSVLPSNIKLTPAVDRWTQTQTAWKSPATRLFIAFAPGWHGANRFTLSTATSTQLVSSTSRQIENLRQIEVKFEAAGFGPGETIASMTFDGIAVTPTPL